MNTILLRWYIITLLLITGATILATQGVFTWIWSIDRSKLSIVDLILFTLSTAYTGYLTYRISRHGDREAESNLRFISYTCGALMGIGMAGTLVNFMSMFNENMRHLDTSNMETVKAVVVQLTVGFSGGVICTLIGVMTSMLLQAQLVNIQTILED